MAFLTLFQTISVKIALRIERGPEPPGRHRLSLSPHAHYVHPEVSGLSCLIEDPAPLVMVFGRAKLPGITGFVETAPKGAERPHGARTKEGSDVAAVECRPRWSKDWADGPLRAACGTAPPWAVSRSPVTREGGANVRASLGGRRARGQCAATRGGPGWRSAGGGRCGAPRRRRGPPV